MPLTIDELTRVLTEDEVLERFLSTLETLKVPSRSWRKAGAARTILRVVARSFSGFTEVMAAFIKSGFLDFAEGHWLTFLARYVYGVERISATFARGGVRLTNTGGGIFNEAPYTVTALWSAGKKSYRNVETIALGAGESKVFTFEAVESGSASSVAAGGIDKLETVLVNVTCANPTALVGTDDELDPVLRQRCRDRLDSVSPNGPPGAYDYAVRSAKRLDGTAVDINRVSRSPSSSTGIVTIYVASPSGAPLAADLPIIATNVDKVARPDTVRVILYPAGEVPISKTFVVWAKALPGLGVEHVKGPVEAALVDLVKNYPIGGIAKPPSTQGYLYADAMKGAAKGAHAAIFDVDGQDTDVALSPGQVAVLTATVDVRLVAL